MNPIKSIVHQCGRWYVKQICLSEYRHQKFSPHNERSIEYRFALQHLGRLRPRRVLDVGSGMTSWPHLLQTCGYVVTAIDNVRDYWDAAMFNRHWPVNDVSIANPGTFAEKFDAITCISVLEHIQDHEAAIRNMLSLLEPHGRLILTCPYNHTEYSANVYERPDAFFGKDLPYICRSYSANEFEAWLASGGLLEKRELWRGFSGPVWATGQYVKWEQAESESSPHQLGCFVIAKTQSSA